MSAKDAAGISQPTFYRDMQQLIAAGLVEPVGSGRYRTYVLARPRAE